MASRNPTPWCCALVLVACTPYSPGSEVLPLRDDQGVEEFADAAAADSSDQPGQDWSCLAEEGDGNGGRNSVPDTLENSSSVTYSLRLYDLRARTIVPEGLNGRACSVGDVLCEEPISVEESVDDEGFLRFSVPRGFTGYFEAYADGFVPIMDFPAAVERDTLQFGYAMIPLSVVPQLAEVNQISLVENLAIVALTTADCQGVRAPRVSFANDVGGLAFYFQDDFPRRGLTSTTLDGAGGFVNVPVGSILARAVLADTSEVVRTRILLTRANWASYAHLKPARGALDQLPQL